ncbi:MAG: AAA family ATPase [Lachnospiraceae bacterium]|nr:AAA family ATPase [Lachnospiraceae bacterium]
MEHYKASDRNSEETYLKVCESIIQKNIDMYLQQSKTMGDEIKELYDNYRSNNPELHNDLVISIAMKEQVDEALKRNERALVKPYFGRVDYIDKEDEEGYTLYLGKNGVVKDGTEPLIIDWRAPVSGIYYENQVGEGSYLVPEQGCRQVRLDLKRTYEIADGKLLDYYDADVIANDELLTKYLGKNKEAVLGEIIATIQKEQNDIIRETPYRNTIVQGVAGSGKTTVAMHRISYILYNYGEKFKPQEFYIIGSNKMLLNYITGVLPDLDVRGINQMVMEDFFIWLLDRDFKEKSYKVIRKEPGEEELSDKKRSDHFQSFKSSLEWLDCLKGYLGKLETRTISREPVLFREREVYTTQAIEDFLENNKGYSIQNKINLLNKRVLVKVKNYLEMLDAEPEVIREESKRYKEYFGGRSWKTSLLDSYMEFVQELAQEREEYREGLNGLLLKLSKKELDVYDLASLSYMKQKIKSTEEIDDVRHIVIDEAQDFGTLVFGVMKEILVKATYTIMGDVSQNINYASGMNDWEVLKTEIFSPERDRFHVLAKSYRNTIEISKFAENILKHGSFKSYKIEPIIRHGAEPELLISSSPEEMAQSAVQRIQGWQKAGYETIAVICRDKEESRQVKRLLSENLKLEETEGENAAFATGIMVLPVALTKGLEFDTVLLWNPTEKQYPKSDANVKLLYVAATRALHELAVAVCEETMSLVLANVGDLW